MVTRRRLTMAILALGGSLLSEASRTGLTRSDLESNLSVEDPMAAIAPLLGRCPKKANSNDDIEGAWCDSAHMIKCCNHACRYRTSKSNRDTVVPQETIDKLAEMGLPFSDACCRQTITLDIDGTWTCRKSDIPMRELLDQMTRGPMTHRWGSFAEAMLKLYNEGIFKLESYFSSEYFYYKGPMTRGEALAKPLVMTMGGYSTGKTTFIKSLIGKEYRGMHIGAEPTTDKFTIIQHGLEETITSGEILAVDPQQEFGTLAQFGTGFLRSFQGALVNSPALQDFSIVDTPGVLSGSKQFQRDYDFLKTARWFADRSDLILLMFDVHKIDISDELKRVIKNLGPNQYKVRIVLNKADSLDPSALLRSYGGLMYGLGRVFDTPELKRIYVGSFQDGEYKEASEILHSVFEHDKGLLMTDLKHLAKESLKEKLNKFIQRIKLAKAHATLLDEIKSRKPTFGWGSKSKAGIISSLDEIYKKVEGVNGVARGDLPSLDYMQEKLETFDFNKIPPMKEKYIHAANDALGSISSMTAILSRAFEGIQEP
eukprot:TRINITY_DN36525_c0_g1_i1.p1 TRINITY_DN36525_c0_g1~~TRINITY_DN36525_c0_g1_i1.p1  ORF type:complete len:541 (-),score=101.39 TRINITY_DN36525_c0_g1_i1:90-1712(-)